MFITYLHGIFILIDNMHKKKFGKKINYGRKIFGHSESSRQIRYIMMYKYILYEIFYIIFVDIFNV